MSIFSKIGAAIGHFFSNLFKDIKTDGDKIAIAITEGIQTALKSGIVTDLASVISGIFPGVKNIPQDLVVLLNNYIPKLLASELALQGLPDNPTAQQLLDFENAVLAAFNVHDDKSKLWTSIAAGVYGLLLDYQKIPNPTFADKVKVVEAAYQLILSLKTQQEAGTL